MKNKKIILTFGTLLIACLLFAAPAKADTSDESGGQVTTGMKISFYEEKAKPTPSPDKKQEKIEKSGILPKTGEQVKNYTIIAGILLLISMSFLLLLKKIRGKKA